MKPSPSNPKGSGWCWGGVGSCRQAPLEVPGALPHKVDLGEALAQGVQAAVGQGAGRQLDLLQPRQLAQQDEQLHRWDPLGTGSRCEETVSCWGLHGTPY